MEKKIEELTNAIRESFDRTMELLSQLSKTYSRDKKIGEEAKRINAKMCELLENYNTYYVGYREYDWTVRSNLGFYLYKETPSDEKLYKYLFFVKNDFNFMILDEMRDIEPIDGREL